MSDRQEIFALAHQILRARDEQGQATYGKALISHDGRDTLQDALEEAADLFIYLIKLKWERDHQDG